MAIEVKFCTGTHVPVVSAKFDVNRCNESPLRGEKPDFWPVSKLNTGSLPLGSILPVIMRIFTVYVKPLRQQAACNAAWRCVRTRQRGVESQIHNRRASTLRRKDDVARWCTDHQSVSENWCAAGGPTDKLTTESHRHWTAERRDGRTDALKCDGRRATTRSRALTAGLYATSFRPSINPARQAILTSWFTSCRPRRRRQLTCICRSRCNPRRRKLNVEELPDDYCSQTHACI